MITTSSFVTTTCVATWRRAIPLDTVALFANTEKQRYAAMTAVDAYAEVACAQTLLTVIDTPPKRGVFIAASMMSRLPLLT